MRSTGVEDRVVIRDSKTGIIFNAIEGDSLPLAGPEEILKHLKSNHASEAALDSGVHGRTKVHIGDVFVHTLHGEGELRSFDCAILNKVGHEEGSNLDIFIRE